MLSPLLLASLFTAMMWMVYFPGAMAVRGARSLLSANPKHNPVPLPESTSRWVQAHQNMLENLPSFIAVCLAVELSGHQQYSWTVAGYVFVIARILHFVFYGLGVPYLRTLMFFAAWLSTLFIGFSLLLQRM